MSSQSCYDHQVYMDNLSGGVEWPEGWETRHHQAFRAEGPSMAQLIAQSRRDNPQAWVRWDIERAQMKAEGLGHFRNGMGACAGCGGRLGSENEERGAFRYHPQCAATLDEQGLKRLATDETPNYEWRDE